MSKYHQKMQNWFGRAAQINAGESFCCADGAGMPGSKEKGQSARQ